MIQDIKELIEVNEDIIGVIDVMINNIEEIAIQEDMFQEIEDSEDSEEHQYTNLCKEPRVDVEDIEDMIEDMIEDIGDIADSKAIEDSQTPANKPV